MPTPFVRLAHLQQAADLDAAVPLFDAYRRFYGRESDLPGARAFLHERGVRGDSVLLLAFLSHDVSTDFSTDVSPNVPPHDTPAAAVGFTQLYPMFSSVGMARTFVLNDLYVAEPARRHGVGRALLDAAAAHGRAAGALRLGLSTATDNLAGQALYEAQGWRRDNAFFQYQLALR